MPKHKHRDFAKEKRQNEAIGEVRSLIEKYDLKTIECAIDHFIRKANLKREIAETESRLEGLKSSLARIEDEPRSVEIAEEFGRNLDASKKG